MDIKIANARLKELAAEFSILKDIVEGYHELSKEEKKQLKGFSVRYDRKKYPTSILFCEKNIIFSHVDYIKKHVTLEFKNAQKILGYKEPIDKKKYIKFFKETNDNVIAALRRKKFKLIING